MAGPELYIIDHNFIREIDVFVLSANSAKTRHLVAIYIFECPSCNGTLGIDKSYLEDVTSSIACPYCRVLLQLGN